MISVVTTDVCPRKSLIYIRFTPFSNKCIAFVSQKCRALHLRHTFATRCFEKGMTPRAVQEIMGHVNYNTTISYTHVLDDMKKKEAERIGDFLSDTTSPPTDSKNGFEDLMGIM